MKTKTYNVHSEVIKASIADLLFYGKKITKTSITKNIDDKLYRILSLGVVDINLFPIEPDVDYNQVESIYNQLYK